jgi:hypothetical protein
MAIAALPTALVQHIQLLNRFYVLISSLQVFRTPVPRAGTAQYQHNSTIPTQQHNTNTTASPSQQYNCGVHVVFLPCTSFAHCSSVLHPTHSFITAVFLFLSRQTFSFYICIHLGVESCSWMM